MTSGRMREGKGDDEWRRGKERGEGSGIASQLYAREAFFLLAKISLSEKKNPTLP